MGSRHAWPARLHVPLRLLEVGLMRRVRMPVVTAVAVAGAAAGGCAAGGQYRALHHHFPAFVVSEAGGRWRKAIEVPGTAAVNTGGDAAIESVSCPAAGSCAAGGFYIDGSGNEQAFVVT